MISFKEYWKKLLCRKCVSYNLCIYRKALEKTKIVISECPYFHKEDEESKEPST